MSYITKYTVPFISIKGVSYIVNIQQDGFNGSVTELTGASQPFSVDIDESNFMYAPLRFSKATLRIVTDDYLDDLFSTDPQKYRVLLEREGSVIWRGFIEPEIFTQDFSTTPVELEIGCVSAMSTLENRDFYAGASYTFVSLWSLITKCVTASNGGYGNIYFPWVYAASFAAYNALSQLQNVLESITVSEQNFFDEEGIPMKMSEVVEEFCKLLGWTCVDHSGDLYFIDPDHSVREAGNSMYKGKYGRYDVVLSAQYGYSVYDNNPILPSGLNFQTIGFAGNENSIDKIPGFNKASVKTSTYPVGESNILPMESLANANTETLSLYYSQPDKISADNIYKAIKKFLKPESFKLFQYTPDSSQTLINPDTATPSQANSWLGATLIERMAYKLAETPTEYAFKGMIQVRMMSAPNGAHTLGAKPILECLENVPTAAFANGALGLSLCIQLDFDNNVGSYSMNYFYDDSFPNALLTYLYIPFSINIGDKYLQQDGSWAAGFHQEYFVFDVEKLIKGEAVTSNANKTLSTPYAGLTGRVVAFPNNDPVCGRLNFKLYSPVVPLCYVPGLYIQTFGVSYKILDSVKDKISKDSDRVYENVVNDSYMNEADEINLKISSWDNDELSYSKAILGSSFLKDNLYCVLADTLVRPEEMLINRITGQYSTVKNKTTQVIKYSPQILPFCELSDDYFPDKKFLQIGGSIDYKNESYKVISIEKA